VPIGKHLLKFGRTTVLSSWGSCPILGMLALNVNNCWMCWFFTHILTKCMVQKAKSQKKILSGSVARRDLIPVLKGYEGGFCVLIHGYQRRAFLWFFLIFSPFPDSDLIEVYNMPNPLFFTKDEEHVAVFPLCRFAPYNLKILRVAVNWTITPSRKSWSFQLQVCL
jgi:hypothetical protein